jgi:hypothetical protein
VGDAMALTVTTHPHPTSATSVALSLRGLVPFRYELTEIKLFREAVTLLPPRRSGLVQIHAGASYLLTTPNKTRWWVG